MTLTQTITAAPGDLAPGHLGALTRYAPFELVDDLLDRPGRRGRATGVPMRVAVYFTLALALFPELSCAGVWAVLTGVFRLLGLRTATPTDAGLADLRRRLGPDPVRELFETLARPLGQPRTPGVCYRGLRTVAFDGCKSTRVPETRDNTAWLGLHPLAAGAVVSYPLLAVMALVETGTRALLGAVVGPVRSEVEAALELMKHVTKGMLALADRGFDADAFIRAVHAAEAELLLRITSSRAPAVLRVLEDGSYLSSIAGVPVRVIEAVVIVTCADGSVHEGFYRLATTLTDARRHPASELVALYHQRWEIEVAFLAIRHTMLKGRVLRSGDPQGLRQEMWALLTAHQLLRIAMTDAAEGIGGFDPDRACFTAALTAARHSVVQAAHILPEPGAELAGCVVQAVAERPLPARRARISARTVKGVSARYAHRPPGEDRPHASTPVTAVDVAIYAPSAEAVVPPEATGAATGAADGPLPPPVPAHTSRLEDVLNTMAADPHRAWRTTELATLLRLDRKSLSGGLHQWARRGILKKAGPGTFMLPDTPTAPSRRAVRLQDVLDVMAAAPERAWRPRDVAAALGTAKPETLAIHMSAWAKKDLLVKTAPAAYKLPRWPLTEAAEQHEPPSTFSKGTQRLEADREQSVRTA